MNCAICGEEINPEATSTYVEKIGWCKNRRQGGSNQITLPRLTGRYVHQGCMQRAKTYGVDLAGQEAMF